MRLVELRLGVMWSLNDFTIEIITAALTETLEALEFSHYPQQTLNLSPLSALYQLRELTLIANQSLTNAAFYNCCTRLKHLERLDVTACKVLLHFCLQ